MKKEIIEKLLNSKKNLIVSGDISSGKTLNVLFPLVEEIINRSQSFLVIDSKEEYINRYYNDLKNKNYNIVILNLRDLNKSEGWNPLEYPYNLYKNGKIDEAINYIENQANIIFYEKNNTDPFWSECASDFYTGIVLGLFEDGKMDEINLNSVDLMFNEVNHKFKMSDYLVEYIKMKNSSSQPYIFTSSTILAPRETRESILFTAKHKLRVYVSREMLSHLLNKTTFDYNDILTKPTAIILIVKDENKYINNVATMFVEQLFSILMDSKSQKEFDFVLDNIDILENVQELINMLGSGISRNIKFEIATRSYEELIKKYGHYIVNLCNSVKIDKDIKLLVDNEEFVEKVEFLAPPIVNMDIKYPCLKQNTIKTFNIKEFVNSKNDNIFNLNSANIDKMIKDIDEKIEELNIEEKIEKIEDANISVKSDFEQFKIDE